MFQTSELWGHRFMMLPRAAQDIVCVWVEECGFGANQAYELVDELLLRQARDPRREIIDFAKDAESLREHFHLWSILTLILFFEHVAPQLQTLGERLETHASLFRSEGVDWPGIRRAVRRADTAYEEARKRSIPKTKTDVWGDFAVQETAGHISLLYKLSRFCGPVANQAAQLIAMLIRQEGQVSYAEAARLIEPNYVDTGGELRGLTVIRQRASKVLAAVADPWRITVDRVATPGLPYDQRTINLLPGRAVGQRGRPRKARRPTD